MTAPGSPGCWPPPRRWCPGPRVAVCIDGGRSYGIGLARALAAAGLLMIECEQPSRKQRRGKGKSCPIDAHLAVLAALRLDTSRLPVPRADGDRAALVSCWLLARRSRWPAPHKPTGCVPCCWPGMTPTATYSACPIASAAAYRGRWRGLVSRAKPRADQSGARNVSTSSRSSPGPSRSAPGHRPISRQQSRP